MYFDYVKELEFSESPDYEYLRGLFTGCAKNNRLDINNIVLDWRVNKDKMAEFLLGTNGKSPTVSPNSRTMVRNNRSDIKIEHPKEHEKEKEHSMLNFSSKVIQNNNKSNNGTMNSLNNFYVPSKTYLKEDKFEDSKRGERMLRNEKKNDITIISLNNSCYSKLSKSNSKEKFNVLSPPKIEMKCEDCNFFLWK